MTTSQKLYDSLQNGYKVRSTKNGSDEHIQHVRLDPDYATPDTTPITIVQTSISLVATDGTQQLLASNASGNHGYIVAPKSNTTTVYLSFNSPATVDDFPMPPGSVFQLTANFGGRPLTNALYYYSPSSGQKLIKAVG